MYTSKQNILGGWWSEEAGMTLEAPPSGSSSKQASSWWLGSSSFWWAFGQGQASGLTHILKLCSKEIIHMHGRRSTGVLLALAENVMWSRELAKRTTTPTPRGCHEMSSFCRLHIIWIPTANKENYFFAVYQGNVVNSD